MKYNFNVKSSSSDEVYTVVFNIDELTSIKCNCKAGLVKVPCKHWLSLLDGDITSLVNPKDSELLSEVLSKIDKNSYANLYEDLNKVEAEIKKLNALKTKLKKEIGIKISAGF